MNRIAAPAVEPLARKIAIPVTMDLMGFWMAWHLEGGFDGLRRLGMSRSSIYRRISLFRRTLGVHPDEYKLPGVTLDIASVRAQLKTSLADYKVPKHVEIQGNLPREDSGKIFKRRLRDPYWERAGRRI